MKFTNLTATEFMILLKMPYSHFTQMTENYELKVAEKTETHLVGIKNKDNEVIAACMLTAVPVMKIFKYFIQIVVQSLIMKTKSSFTFFL